MVTREMECEHGHTYQDEGNGCTACARLVEEEEAWEDQHGAAMGCDPLEGMEVEPC